MPLRNWFLLWLLLFCCGCAQAAFEQLSQLARKEGVLMTATMPDDWANWGQTWRDMKSLFGVTCRDTDMSSAEVIYKIKAEKKHSTLDMGDSGYEFAGLAKAQKVTLPHKTENWEDIPEWAKDPEGHWVLSYTGTMAFIVNREKVKKIPRSWSELLKSPYKLSVGPVGIGSQPTNAVLSAAIAMGGSERNLMPGIKLFAQLAKEKRLSMVSPTLSNIERGEIEVATLWDFNALNYRSRINAERFAVFIPSDGAITSGYSTIINKWARHPNAARLAREYILSDSGQLNLARGLARPIRDIDIPEKIRSELLPDEQYKNARRISNIKEWRRSIRELSYMWQEHVLVHFN
ncbi:ABC transporter substrate-binding protein [Endozoicomonas sp. OPT23]|uniref:ABC transporter substrate-binding protein n=1 Tax=Endozoicomonas sp. OPT23 TaxID=2072845 RepID=UPI00129B160D|nr:extracellular solute-binding protein [Endozoicomonas sp. OPT23]MRI31484.1 ABC transporter substrate-binding protein [Endozoicomonas sp. OPT23]